LGNERIEVVMVLKEDSVGVGERATVQLTNEKRGK
jgi:hypothetical protein